MRIIPPWSDFTSSELTLWHRFYPQGPGWQLDIGAGCGETANFYLHHGADGVVCIEGDPKALECLYANYGSDPRVIIVPRMISKIKIDIEGSEWGTVVETHKHYPRFNRLTEFGKKYALHRLDPSDRPNIASLSDLRLMVKYLLVWQGAKRRKLIGF